MLPFRRWFVEYKVISLTWYRHVLGDQNLRLGEVPHCVCHAREHVSPGLPLDRLSNYTPVGASYSFW